ncbi:Rho GTPase-activating protein [Striga asiatica]|uniref:Rho GTPase-activating protein n=1 Tax=Striga asiatica TaxID=4170 RepID=A0A5A7QA90_STRAF|nr:Rho GTPase-activating protein [Striga asiatica]
MKGNNTCSPPSPSSPNMCITPAAAADSEPFVSAASDFYCFRKFSSPNIGKLFEVDQISVLELLVAIFRRSFVGCKRAAAIGADGRRMEIGSPSNVRHVAHVTFDRFNGFLGLPVEFEPEVPRRPPSASTRVFGVSTESMQLSFDSRGNCVPTILLMMQRRLYLQGGLESEGIFRINPANGQEEYVREQLNNGLIPDDIDVHCLAGLIKAWFRELPRGVLDCVPAEQVMETESEDECTRLVRLLPPTEAALLDWAVNLMADVAQHEHLNKMNPRNIAMVFAPNMTQMSDPLTALMYAVQVMNFLKTLVTKTLREREDSLGGVGPTAQLDQTNEDHHEQCTSESGSVHIDQSIRTDNESCGFLSSIEKIIADAKGGTDDYSIADKEGLWKNTLRPVDEGDEGITVTTKLKSQSSRGEAWK